MKTADGYSDGWQQYIAEADDDVEECSECALNFEEGASYWSREDELLCEGCFAEMRDE